MNIKPKTRIREKRIYCGDNFLEVDIYPITEQEHKTRKKKEKPSSLKLMNQNDKRARRYFIQKVNTNFTKGDYHISATYKVLPQTIEEAETIARNYIRRIKDHMKKRGLGELKYILITEYGVSKKTGEIVRMHHHIIINRGLDRDEVENLWRERRRKGEKEGKSIGIVNVDRLKLDEYGLTALCLYLTKSPNKKRRWSPSKNLKEPIIKMNDSKYSRRKVENLAKMDNPPYWQQQYPGYILTECKPEYTEERGWAIYIKMRRLQI